MNKIDIWQLAPYLLPVVSYIIGRWGNRLRLPRSIQRLLDNGRVVEMLIRGIEAAEAMKGRTDDEKREYVRKWARSELHGMFGEWLPDSAINYLIEHVIIRRKAGMQYTGGWNG